ncbi:glycosyltransferase family 2 protein [Pseudooceanicola sp.]|uniref:glycosyltransferase family 2 protein n=1 Tax=Pseudooceanicola sp. TaxID=1914328 RepID=UPI0026025655|nr:glycosyltransferase family 2 protein [Pseudooceanicola sp.]MDF1854346.1 glycosyltransferase family 2 protein [Pseudooceanicola sp.]
MQDGNDTEGRLTYAGGFQAVLAQMEGRREPMTYDEGEGLPPLDCDLIQLRDQLIGTIPAELRTSKSGFGSKCRQLHREFAGQPALCYLNGLLIANLRRRDQPPQAAPLFLRLWREHADFLIANLDARWLVSSITTFGDHGATDAQRRVGHVLSVLFNTMKLYETERLFSGVTPEVIFQKGKKSSSKLPLQMDPYAIVGGGLDVNMLGRIWMDAAEDPVVAPLAHHLLEALNRDDRNLFRRLRLMREAREGTRPDPGPTPKHPKKQRQETLFNSRAKLWQHPAPVNPERVEPDPGLLRWGVVSTQMAPLADIARFAAWHLQLGAARVSIYLDDADEAKAAWLTSHPGVEVVLCNTLYWQVIGRRPKAHQLRQTANATHCYQGSDLHWLAHIDVDEFLMPDRPLAEVLTQAPEDIAVILVPPVERLADTDPGAPARFKTTARMGGQTKSVLPEIYPTYGAHLRGGYVSHLEGKCIVRTGIPEVRLGIHSLNLDGTGVSNRVTVNGTYLGHAHAATWEAFRSKLDYRLDHGSYRKKDSTDFRLSDIIDFLRETEGENGLSHFYEEVCTATPRLVQALADHDMLVSVEMDLDAAVEDVFGTLPPDIA